MEKRATSQGSTYGQACMQCYKAKCRCVARADGHGCERCWRLRKQCQPSEPIRRRNNHNQKPETDVQISKLEDKIEALTSTLQSLQSIVKATGVSTNFPSSLTTTNTDGASDYSITSLIPSDVDPVPTALHDGRTPAYSNPNPFQENLGVLSQQVAPPLYEPTPDEVEIYLNLFRNRMLPMFPFLHMPADLTALKLRQERPFLFRAVVAVATPGVQQKVARIEGLKYVLTKAAVLENQSNIDILLSILTYITWSTDPFLKRASNLSRMIMLAISMVYDLNLGNPPPPEAHIIVRLAPGLEESGGGIPGTFPLEFLERQRAFLACFVLSSIISSYFKRIDAIRWTSQMEEGLHIISEGTECPSDEVLACQVRLQLLAQKVAQVREQFEANRINSMATVSSPSTTPAFLYVRVLQGQLKEHRELLSPHLLQSDMLLAYVHYVDLCINEVTRMATSDAPLLATPESSKMDHDMSGFGSLDCLWRCLHAVKSWLDVFSTISPTTYVGFPFFYWFQLIRCIIILKHLSTFDDPAWDCQAVYATVDIMQVLESMAEKAELASASEGEGFDDDNLFRQVSIILRKSQAWINARRKGPKGADGETSNIGDVSAVPVTIDKDMTDLNQLAPWMNAFESGDDSWFQEFLGWSPNAF